MDTSVILSALSAIVSLAALANFYSARRAAIMAQGAKDEKIQRMRDDLDRAHEKIRILEGCQHGSDLEMRDIKKDIEYIKKSVDEIKSMLARAEE